MPGVCRVFRIGCRIALFLPLAFCTAVYGQSQTGSLAGSVTDANDAAVPGAQVVAAQEGTGVTLHTVTSDAGLYVFPNLPVGAWDISVEKPGFKRAVKQGVSIFIAQRQALDFRLEIGEVTQTVQVTAEAPLL